MMAYFYNNEEANMEDTQSNLFKDLPIYEEDLEKMKIVKERVNCLQEVLLELMEEKKVGLAEIQRETLIPMTTLYGWYRGSVNTQLADENLWELAKYFGVTLEYLCFKYGPKRNENND